MGNGLSRRVQLALVAALAVASGAFYAIVAPRPGLSASDEPPRAVSATGTFKPTREQFAALQLATVESRQFRQEHVTEGNIALDDNLNTPVFSPYSGRVVKLIAELGARVERGAPLFAVEAPEFVQGANTLIAAAAAAKTAHSQLMQAEINEKRAHELFGANGGALKDWQQSRTDLAAAQNTARSAEIALAAARNQLRILGKSEADTASLEAQPTQQLDPVAIVTAPIAGIVTQRQVGVGQYIQSVAAGASAPLYTIGDLSKVYLIANMREATAGEVHVGDAVEVRVPAFPGRVFTAKLSWVAPAIDANTHRLPVRAAIDNADGALKPMMFASFTIITGIAATAPAVPQSAVVYEGDQARVWVAGGDGSLALRQIRVGRTADGLIEVTSGLSAGEKVVTKGTVFIDRAGGTS
jgi:membrane fusion protein, heavy metal efflux system